MVGTTGPWRVDGLSRPVDGASLGVLRAAFGLVVLVSVVRYLAYGWVDQLYVQPAVLLPFLDLPRPSPTVLYGAYALVALAAGAMVGGVRTRFAAALIAVAFTWIELLDASAYLNHYVLVSLLAALLAALPTGRVVPAWAVWTVRVQLGLVYFFAGVAKLEPHWLLEAQPLRIWLASKTDFPLFGPLLDDVWVAYAMSWAGCAFDLLVFPLLCWRRTRLVAWLAVLGFHAATGLLFDIGVFPVLMVLGSLVFFEPDWPRRLAGPFRRVVRASAPAAGSAAPVARASSPVLVGLALWLVVQLAVPLRHVAYDGDVWFHKHGWRLSWRVLLVEQRGHFRLRATEPSSGRTWTVWPTSLLSPRQVHEASFHPDLVLQVAHLVAADLRAEGVVDPDVRVDAWMSTNGRPAVRWLDPEVDLAGESRWGLGQWHWVAGSEAEAIARFGAVASMSTVP